MQLPFFYISEFDPAQTQIVLNEDSSRHIVQVLRMKEGEMLNLTDGKGNLITTEIIESHKKHCLVKIQRSVFKDQSLKKVSIAISLLKTTSRFEWFLEKATEIGVTEIIPLICERTEKQKFRYERMKGICISAMLQSQQCRLPFLAEPLKYTEYVLSEKDYHDQFRLIAYCDDKTGRQELSAFRPSNRYTILIGPEGDFTKNEFELAVQKGFAPVTLGNNRLRSETAGVVAAALLCHA